MTAEQAVKWLKDLNKGLAMPQYEDALDMAIQALQAQDKADTAYDRGYDKGYDDGFFDYEVCHKCKHFEYDELFIDVTGEERDTSYCGRQAQADGDYKTEKSCDSCKYSDKQERICYYTGETRCVHEKQADGDLISRQAVLDGIEELKKSPWCTDKRGNGFEYLIAETLEVVADLCIKQASSIEPTVAIPNKTGHWKNRGKDGEVLPFYMRYECSECGETADKSNFCPNCGVKMVEPQEISDHNLKMWEELFKAERSNKE